MWVHVPSEFCPYAVGQGHSKLDLSWTSRRLSRSATWRGKLISVSDWLAKYKTVTWTMLLFGQISEPLKASRGVEKWIALLLDSPVSHLVEQEEDKKKNTNIGYGKICLELSKKSNHHLSLGKMSIPSVSKVEQKSSEILPRSGMIAHGIFIQLDPLEPHIYVRDCSFSPREGTAWTTPCSDDTGLRKKRYSQGGTALSLQIRQYWQKVHNCNPVGQNPDFRDALMGWPIGWSGYGPLGTESFQKWLQGRGGP